MDRLTKDPFLFLIYFLIAAVVIANIFISGYWFGRSRQVLDEIRPIEAAVAPSPKR